MKWLKERKLLALISSFLLLILVTSFIILSVERQIEFKDTKPINEKKLTTIKPDFKNMTSEQMEQLHKDYELCIPIPYQIKIEYSKHILEQYIKEHKTK